jgi:hypothetical protein
LRKSAPFVAERNKDTQDETIRTTKLEAKTLEFIRQTRLEETSSQGSLLGDPIFLRHWNEIKFAGILPERVRNLCDFKSVE